MKRPGMDKLAIHMPILMNPMVMSPSMFLSDNSPNNQLAGIRIGRRSTAYPGEMVKVPGEIGGRDKIRKGMLRAYSLLDMPLLISLDAPGIPI